MAGIGISMESQDSKGSAKSTDLISLPQKVVDEIAAKLGIMTAKTKRALTSGKISLPEGVTVTITRKKNKEKITIKKLPGSAQYRVTYKGKSKKI